LHLGIYFDNPKRIDVNDCVSDEFFNLFKSTASTNTKTYDEVFKCLPSDNILTFQELALYSKKDCLAKNDPVKVSFSIF
jgi:phospholipase D1/2